MTFEQIKEMIKEIFSSVPNPEDFADKIQEILTGIDELSLQDKDGENEDQQNMIDKLSNDYKKLHADYINRFFSNSLTVTENDNDNDTPETFDELFEDKK